MKKYLQFKSTYNILQRLAKKAMTQEVAELSGNFCRELSVLETGEGILMLFALCKK